MAAVFRELTFQWKGKEYRVKPTMTILNRIEQGDISLSVVAYRISKGNPPLSHLATIIAQFLQAAGARDATPENVYAEIMDGDESSIQDMTHKLMLAVFPQLGKDEAPTTTKAKAKKPAASK